MTIQPFSTEWYAREKAWIDKCNGNFEKAADDLVAKGYTRKDHDRRWYPSTFHKGDMTLVLVRNLGSSQWYSRPHAERTG